ncbi:MAG: GTPase HflX [Abditibacteriota bacterium]|nr:GTPase HflX [Abditibacteriota bacterium]MBP5093300.1 GTPase HflX [Abditibacteriota bacterium]MBP5718863.1 GTPase HflX [Abditibacteriota bacterium]MBP5739112.1 GTPase HflX [Abditibacteriota bacterium]
MAELKETESGRRAVMLCCDFEDSEETKAFTEELRLLMESCDLEVVCDMHVRRKNPDPGYYIGPGNAEQLFSVVSEYEADCVVIGTELTPTQQRNIEDAARVKVIDRTRLILDIFAKRARSNEGKVQTELATLKYMLPRLGGGKGKDMDRIGSGSAGVAARGAGETKLEVDRKRIRRRIGELTKEIESISRHRDVQNKVRKSMSIPRASLVGYTSAGKSTLMNLLTGAEAETNPRLFETLDPMTRRAETKDGSVFMLSDTVGFLRDLPHRLIAAFKATLSEAAEADFLIHVVDASSPHIDYRIDSVDKVLEELGAGDKPTITVFNKCDGVRDQSHLRALVADTPDSCYMSALTGEGAEYLYDLITETIDGLGKTFEGVIPFGDAKLADMIHTGGRVLSSSYEADGIHIEAVLPPDLYGRVKRFSVK